LILLLVKHTHFGIVTLCNDRIKIAFGILNLLEIIMC
jgi:hypothetical protein